MATNKTGMIIHFDEEKRSNLIRENIDNNANQSFSDALSVPDWEIGRLSIALICFSPNTINFIALAKKGKQVVTSKSRVEFSGFVNLDSIDIQSIENKLSTSLKTHFTRATQGIGSAVPEGTWSKVIDAIKAARPTLSEDIDRLLTLRRYSGFHFYGNHAELLVQEREAIGISLDIFSGTNNLRESVLGQWAPQENSVSDANEAQKTAWLKMVDATESSFMKGIPSRFIQEESALQHDLMTWDGMTPKHSAGLSVFKTGNRQLEIHYANKNPLETTLGVDLIYYNVKFELFVLVQYKLMAEEGSSFLYRPDKQLKDQLKRMDDFYDSSSKHPAISSDKEFRLSDDGFMVKLVPNRGLIPASGELIRGMYLPRQYMHFLLSPQGPKGPKGGSQLSFESAPRYLTNSQFAESVNAGWIGTRGASTKKVRELIRCFYETGSALVVAYERA